MICRDHLGNVFKSQTAMCEYWHISVSEYTNRIKKGWNLELALTYTPDMSSRIDHLGKVFESTELMCKHWGISLESYQWRRDKGWTVEQALTLKDGAKPVKDHLGNSFESERAMCEYWNSDINLFVKLAHVNPGLSVERRLELSERSGTDTLVIDHLGNKFKTIEEMCEYHNTEPSVYNTRRKRGMTVEQALTAVKMIRGLAIDPFGNKFNSVKDMCKAYNISVSVFRARLREGWDTEEALIVPVKKKK